MGKIATCISGCSVIIYDVFTQLSWKLDGRGAQNYISWCMQSDDSLTYTE